MVNCVKPKPTFSLRSVRWIQWRSECDLIRSSDVTHLQPSLANDLGHLKDWGSGYNGQTGMLDAKIRREIP